MTVDRSIIRVKAMLIAPNHDRTAHAVSLNPPTAEHPEGYHRLIGGGVELGETHRQAILREVDEELGATTECDGSVVPVVWRSLTDQEALPLFPAGATAWADALQAGVTPHPL